jgi:hypothetical protein
MRLTPLDFGFGIGVTFHAPSFCSGDTPEVSERDGDEIDAENASLVGFKNLVASCLARQGSIASSNSRR